MAGLRPPWSCEAECYDASVRREWIAVALVAAGATAEVQPRGLELVGDAVAAAAPTRLEVPYDRVVQRTIHNAYARQEPLIDQLLWHGVRSLELDIHTVRAGVPAVAGDWMVFHEDIPLARSSSCPTLEACLGAIAAFHRAVPEHDVLTLFVDVKSAFAPGHATADLDAALVRGLGRDVLATPEDLVAHCPGARSVREAVSAPCTFPTGGQLRGKVLVAITGGTACAPATPVSRYDAEGGHVAFVAPNADATCPVEAYDDPRRTHVAFVNLSFEERTRATQVRARGLVARVYYGGIVGGLDSEQDFFEARRTGAQLLATDAVNAGVDRWSIPAPQTSLAWQGPNVREAEPGSFALVDASSGDLGGERDDFFFAHARSDTSARETWATLFSVSSSHVEPLAQTCLMARASAAPDAPHASICRPLDEGAPRLVVRARRGGPTTVRPLDAGVDGSSLESHAFFRLHVEPAKLLARGLVVTHVVAQSSTDGEAWSIVGAASVAGELPLRGVAVASRTSTPVQTIVGHLARGGDGGLERVRMESLVPAAVGAKAGGRVTPLRRL